MHPVPIPDEEVWDTALGRIVVGAPDGDLTNESIYAVEAVVDLVGLENRLVRRFCVKLVLEDGELEHLAAGGCVWLETLGSVPVFNVYARPIPPDVPGS